MVNITESPPLVNMIDAPSGRRSMLPIKTNIAPSTYSDQAESKGKEISDKT